MDAMQIILLTIAGLIILFVIINSLIRFFKNRHTLSDEFENEIQEGEVFPNIKEDESEVTEKTTETQPEPLQVKKNNSTQADSNKIIMISVHAKPNTVFSDYSFLQTMGSVGLDYGDYKIFHYDEKTDLGIQRLFSVAQLNKPGTFDIDPVENIRCKGLLLFIDLRACRKQTLALDCMLETAYQLAEDLDGIMHEGYNSPWQDDTPRALSQRLELYQKNSASPFDEITY